MLYYVERAVFVIATALALTPSDPPQPQPWECVVAVAECVSRDIREVV